MCVSPLSPYASLDHVGAVAAGGVDGHLVEHLGERDARRAVVLLGELGVVDGRRLVRIAVDVDVGAQLGILLQVLQVQKSDIGIGLAQQ